MQARSARKEFSLRTRLVAWALVMLSLTMIVAGVELFGRYQLEKVGRRRDTDDQIARLALRAGTALLRARRYEKDFLLFRRELGFQEAKARYVTLARLQIDEVQHRMADIRASSADPAMLNEARTVELATHAYEAGLLRVVDLYRTLGFFDSGLEGAMRAKAHAIEAAIGPRGSDTLVAGLLAMRRDEKDFIARGRDVYVKQIESAGLSFKSRAARSAFPAGARASLQTQADAYLAAFRAYVQTTEQIEQAHADYLTSLQVVEPALGRLTARVAEIEVMNNDRITRLNRTTTTVSLFIMALAVLLSGLLAYFVVRSVNRSLSQTLGFAGRLAAGDLDARMGTASSVEVAAIGEALNRMADSLREAYAGLERRVAERTAELAQLTDEAKHKAVALQARNEESSVLGVLGDLLQRCATVEEACEIIPKHAARLFSGSSGGLYLTSASRIALERMAAWGELPPAQTVFAPDDCWALRRGLQHLSSGASGGPRCPHTPVAGYATLCVPMSSHGETVGVVSLHAAAGSDWEVDQQRLATRLAELTGLSLTNTRLRANLRSLSIRDALTGLFNRRYLEETLERELHRAQRGEAALSVLVIDVDHFKRVNDTFGHDAGDVVLRDLGALMRLGVRGSDIPCRYGGEEFVLVLPEASLDMALQRAEALRRDAAELKPKFGTLALGSITLSIGVAAYPVHGTNGGQLVSAADAALYQAKAAGRNRVCAAGSAALEKAVS